uniref:D-xylose 1-dehydrogenase (NADP(+), D-xylono-1,5-lactone-forming) n=1 Tax=Mycena chlorophos TaxID=658473 RepID=A0ABQ0LIS2_MYCCL|nr:predicted protein [Mycena chlorophos]
MSSILGFVSRTRSIINPPEAKPTDSTPLRFGILGAANIAPDALIKPVKSHPEAVVYAVAARSKDRAAAFAKTHRIEKVYGSYQELLDDPNVDCIYNPLPNGLHYEWTMKALAAGKHVLLEKPASNTAEEARAMFELAEQKNVVLLEAFHYRFHPAVARIKEIVESGEIGQVKAVKTSLKVSGFMKAGDIRFNYALGGGALMDMGCYTINAMRHFSGQEPTSVTSATHQLVTKALAGPGVTDFERVDKSADVTFALSGGAVGTISCDLDMPARLGLIPKLPDLNATITGDKGEIKVVNYIMPTLYHSITVKSNGKERVEKVYKFPNLGEPWWTTYRYQLEAFVNKVKGRPVHHWVDKENTVKNMVAIESVYVKNGLGVRPKSDWVPPQ